MLTTVNVKFPKITLDDNVINNETEILASNLERLLTNHAKLAIVSFGAIATGTNLRAIHAERIKCRRVRFFGRGDFSEIKFRIVGDASLKFIISGRRPGAPMPIHKVGTGPRGGKIFEPLPAMLRWVKVM